MAWRETGLWQDIRKPQAAPADFPRRDAMVGLLAATGFD
jgi:hypothetical protein